MHVKKRLFFFFSLSLEPINISAVIHCCPDDLDNDSDVLKQEAKWSILSATDSF